MRTISVADYFIETLIANDVTEVFGYQGGMIAYIFDSLGKYRDKINYHSCATEQGAALAAVGYSQATGRLGVAISTSGPGFTNLLTGMADAWFDSVPVLYISGNVNTKDKKRTSNFRQNGFQEIQAAEMAKPITKLSVEFELGMDYPAEINKAIRCAISDRKGPVYIDLPINVCRELVEFDSIEKPEWVYEGAKTGMESHIKTFLEGKKPVLIAGAGIKQADAKDAFVKLVETMGIPVVTTMPAVDLLPSDSEYMMGYIGGTARREAGIVLQNADRVISIGTRLCSKQIGHNMSLFAPKAEQFVRVDIDEAEFERQLKDIEVDVVMDVNACIDDVMSYLNKVQYEKKHQNWLQVCNQMKETLSTKDMTEGNKFFKELTKELPENADIVLDVGKNLNYGTQSSCIKTGTTMYMSAGLGTMGYALPAAMGISLGKNAPTFAFMGDGGAQMNIQELNTIAKNNIPVKAFVLNNKALGNIRIFQENFLDSRFVATSEHEGDYYSCDFAAIAKAYGIRSYVLDSAADITKYADVLADNQPALFEFVYEDCAALPGIVAGGGFLNDNTGIDDVAAQIRESFERI